MANFLYTPKSGSKITMFPRFYKRNDNNGFTKTNENDSKMEVEGSGIVVVTHNNDSYHILNAAHISVYAVSPDKYFREEANAVAMALASEYNGIAYDDCGRVGVYIPQQHAVICHVAMLFVEPKPNYAVLDLYGIDKRKFFSLLNGINAIPFNRETAKVKTELILQATQMLQKELVKVPKSFFDTLYVSKNLCFVNDEDKKFILGLTKDQNFVDRITFPLLWGEPDIWI